MLSLRDHLLELSYDLDGCVAGER